MYAIRPLDPGNEAVALVAIQTQDARKHAARTPGAKCLDANRVPDRSMPAPLVPRAVTLLSPVRVVPWPDGRTVDVVWRAILAGRMRDREGPRPPGRSR